MARKLGDSTLKVVARAEWKSTPELISPSSCSPCALHASAVCPASQGLLVVRSLTGCYSLQCEVENDLDEASCEAGAVRDSWES